MSYDLLANSYCFFGWQLYGKKTVTNYCVSSFRLCAILRDWVFSKLAINDTLLHFLLVLCEYKVAPVVLGDPPLGAKDVLILN
jgi:hypothetical protein